MIALSLAVRVVVPAALISAGVAILVAVWKWRWIASRTSDNVERNAIQLGVPALAAVSISVALLLDVPAELPAAALGSKWTLYGIRVLAIFYGALLIFVPVIRSLRGQLPVELSWRGAKYEDAAMALRDLKALVDKQAVAVDTLTLSVLESTQKIADLEDRIAGKVN
jgi:hypothetical protein